MSDEKDQILRGKGFQSWRYDYEMIIRSVNTMEEKPHGERLALEVGPLSRAASRYYQLEELLLKAMSLAAKGAGEDAEGEEKGADEHAEKVRKMVEGRKEKFYREAKEDLRRVVALADELQEMWEEIEGKEEEAQRLSLTSMQDEDNWGDVAVDGVQEEKGELERKMQEKISDLKGFLINASAHARWGAARALMAARDVGSMVKFAYAETWAKTRSMALDEIRVAVGLGAELGREERSMLLRMTEDMDAGIAEKAWAIALKMFNRKLLDDEQVDYLVGRQEGEKPVLVNLLLRFACTEGADADERAAALERAEEAVWLGAKPGKKELAAAVGLMENADEGIARQASSLVNELVGKGIVGEKEIGEMAGGKTEPAEAHEDGVEEAAPGGEVGPLIMEIDDFEEEAGAEEVRVLEMEDEDIPFDPLRQAMGQLEQGELANKELAELVVLADGIGDNAERKRVFDRILDVLGPEKQLGSGKADAILGKERMSRFVLRTISDGRPSGVSMRRKSEPPSGAERKSVPPVKS